MTPTARSLAYLRKSGALAGVVEKYNAHARRRFDLFGFIDIVAIWGGHPGWTLGVQATTTEHISHRLDKLRSECEPSMRRWIEAGNQLVIHGWAKRGPRGKRKAWTLTERHVTIDDLLPGQRDALATRLDNESKQRVAHMSKWQDDRQELMRATPGYDYKNRVDDPEWTKAKAILLTLATRLADAEKERDETQAVLDRTRIAASTRLARVEEALRLYEEYVQFLYRENEGPVSLAFNHGWRCPQEVVDKGVEYRARIAALTPDAAETTDG